MARDPSTNSVLDGLRARARVLQRRAEDGDAEALTRLGERPDGAPVQRRHALAALARELGFEGWPHAKAVLGGDRVDDFGTLMLPPSCRGHWNIWSASYAEAAGIRADHGGYLLAYKRHFFIVDRHYVESMGLDPDDEDWARVGRDLVRSDDRPARLRLFDRLVQARLG